MFSSLTDKFNNVFRNLSGKGKISEANVREAMVDVKSALLEADVHYEVVEAFLASVQEKALGEVVLESLKPGQQMIKIVNDELIRLMAGDEVEEIETVEGEMLRAPFQPLMLVEPGPTVVMLCGLQGSGKTTHAGKLAAYLKKKGKKVMLVAGDLQRPAAVDQLETLANQVNETIDGPGEVMFYAEKDKVAEYGKAVGVAVKIARNGVKAAKKNQCDVVILDTAGRLHVNDELMGELRQMNAAVNPHEILLVIDAMTGQDAVNSAKAFNDQLELDGVILTKFDSDTRGGAALSVKHVTGKAIRFIGVGETLEAIEEFHPDRIASRILGMGDVLSLVEKAQEQVSAEEAMELQEKMSKGKMTMDDFLDQLKKVRKMGSMKGVLGMLPGIGQQLKDMPVDESQLDRTEAVIKSMTKQERTDVDVIDQPRRRRIAKGSGTEPQDVSQLVKGFEAVSQMGQQMSGMNMFQRMKAMSGMGGMDMAALGGGGMAKTKGGSGRGARKNKVKRRKGKRR